MELVVRGAVVYLILFIILRAAGNREFSGLTSFDAVLLIIIAETTTQALAGGEDFSLTAALILITTLVSLDIALSLIKKRSPRAALAMEGVPVLLVEHGKLLRENIEKERVDENDVLEAARSSQGLEEMKQIKYAILERNGSISVIPA
jgi:uncharacterized membrane protein YcaP (DUF421 family)